MIFLDTSYLFALVNRRDRWHSVALDWQQAISARNEPLLTTEFVLVELLDILSRPRSRRIALAIRSDLVEQRRASVIGFEERLYARGLVDYERHDDKSWSLTDCLSFVVMRDQGLSDALTSDQHFVQAGFRALLLESP